MSLHLNQTVSRAGNLAQRLFEERMLVITAHNSTLHRFNEVGTFLWQQLDTPKTVDRLIQSVAENFQGFDAKRDSRDIMRFLEELGKKKLIEIKDNKANIE